jgi:hypothetical protein
MLDPEGGLAGVLSAGVAILGGARSLCTQRRAQS